MLRLVHPAPPIFDEWPDGSRAFGSFPLAAYHLRKKSQELVVFVEAMEAPTEERYTEGSFGRRFSPQFRQAILRRALRVRHLAQVMYMARTKRLVTTALIPRMATTSVIWSRVELIIKDWVIDGMIH